MSELTATAAKFIQSATDKVALRADNQAAATISATTTAAVKNAFGKDAIKKTAAAAAAAPVADLPKVVVPGVIELRATAAVEGFDTKIDAPRMSPDGQLLTYVRRETKDIPSFMKTMLGLPTNEPTERMTAFLAHTDGSIAPVKIAGRTFHNIVEPAFSPDGKSVIYCAQKNLPFLAYGERLKDMRLEKLDLATNTVTTIYNGERSFLHPQYSPDGSKLAVYCRDKGHEGIYVFDTTKPGSEALRLSTGNEKHPVWSADGKTIFFHNQVGGDATAASADGTEQAWLGKIDLTAPRGTKPVMLDDISQPSYHKHPAPLPNSDLVIYHNGDHKLEVVDTKTGQRAQLKLDGTNASLNHADVSKFKHVSVNPDGSVIALGMPAKKNIVDRGIPDTWSIYQLPSADTIIKAFKAALP
jgi:Tol biopolymer transport system component